MRNKKLANTLAVCFAPLPLAISLATASLVSPVVQAACTPAFSPGASVTCSGSMLGITSGVNNLQVTIASGAMIQPAVVNTGSVVTLTGNNATFINHGRVDPTLLIGLAVRTSGVRIGNTNNSIVNVTNNGILRGSSDLSDFNGPLANVTGVALHVQNGFGGTTTINNNGTLDGAAILGYSIAASDIPVIAVTGTKAMISYMRDHTVNDGLEYVATWNSAMLQSNDLRVAIAAHMSKQKPEFVD